MKRAASLLLAAAVAGAGANAQTSGNGANTAPSTATAISAAVPPALVPVAPPPAPPPAISSWVVSETRSPVDYSPVAIATAAAVPEGSLRLSIQCRGGRTEMLVATTPSARFEDHAVSYTVNGGSRVAVAIAPPIFGSGLALKGDVAAFLAGLPEQGEISLSVTNRQGTVDGRYALGGLKTLVSRLKAPCQWRN
jgi:hypothetical protein